MFPSVCERLSVCEKARLTVDGTLYPSNPRKCLEMCENVSHVKLLGGVPPVLVLGTRDAQCPS